MLIQQIEEGEHKGKWCLAFENMFEDLGWVGNVGPFNSYDDAEAFLQSMKAKAIQ